MKLKLKVASLIALACLLVVPANAHMSHNQTTDTTINNHTVSTWASIWSGAGVYLGLTSWTTEGTGIMTPTYLIAADMSIGASACPITGEIPSDDCGNGAANDLNYVSDPLLYNPGSAGPPAVPADCTTVIEFDPDNANPYTLNDGSTSMTYAADITGTWSAHNSGNFVYQSGNMIHLSGNTFTSDFSVIHEPGAVADLYITVDMSSSSNSCNAESGAPPAAIDVGPYDVSDYVTIDG